jgi:hypothetical protein
MKTYDEVLAEAVKMMDSYSTAACHADELLRHKVNTLYEPGISKARDIARILGKSVQQIQRIIDKLIESGSRSTTSNP